MESSSDSENTDDLESLASSTPSIQATQTTVEQIPDDIENIHDYKAITAFLVHKAKTELPQTDPNFCWPSRNTPDSKTSLRNEILGVLDSIGQDATEVVNGENADIVISQLNNLVSKILVLKKHSKISVLDHELVLDACFLAGISETVIHNTRLRLNRLLSRDNQ